ncbi:hypothetical protein [uncultured Desulfovibrio sp.]|uniref:hypothetical protein n=1 Tax=uncultured Desulfovibrio sp. TaxID=167968 RepID=UPI002805AF7F|nr:hypothetical protein [uncultured Desulfovibrio sp.]
MNSGRIESIVSEYLANKEQADKLTLRNAELAEEMQALAIFAPGSDTGRLEACGYKVSVTKRINEKWDQHQLAQVREVFTDDLFFTLFRQEFKPDRRSLKVFMHGQSDAKLKAMLIRACTTSAGKPSIKLEKMEACQ